MFLATAIVLTSLTAALPPARVASTYDEAACVEEASADAEPIADAAALVNEDALLDRADREAPVNCSEAPPPAPAVIDCNDERASRFVAEMIGSCDMPKPPAPTGGPAVVRAANERVRICDGIHCSHDSSPIRAAGRAPDDGRPLAASRFTLSIVLTASPLHARAEARPRSCSGARLERPPRTV